jgi:hypothetical protein
MKKYLVIYCSTKKIECQIPKPVSPTIVYVDVWPQDMTMNLDNDICDLMMNIISNVIQNKMLLEHLFVDLMQIVGQQWTLIVEFTNGLVHPHTTSQIPLNWWQLGNGVEVHVGLLESRRWSSKVEDQKEIVNGLCCLTQQCIVCFHWLMVCVLMAGWYSSFVSWLSRFRVHILNHYSYHYSIFCSMSGFGYWEVLGS